jgi:hypothetical protein
MELHRGAAMTVNKTTKETAEMFKTITQTCEACPSQWEGELVDGRFFYARYRWGYLSVRVSDSKENIYNGKEIVGESIGNGLDGLMTTSEMISAVETARKAEGR